jgi:hypothetical protein
MKKLLVLCVMAVTGFAATTANAGAPTNPGCFGQDRAAYAMENGSLGNDVGGVGYWASLRAGDNGSINQAYKTSCGGDPT